MGYFKEWLLAEEAGSGQMHAVATVQEATKLAQTTALDVDTQGLERVAKVLKGGGSVWYTDAFQISELGRNRQGWAADHVLGMFSRMAQKLGLNPPETLQDAQKLGIKQGDFNRMISPVIVSLMPDESYHIDDGNHRLGCAIVLKFPTVRAFVLQS